MSSWDQITLIISSSTLQETWPTHSSAARHEEEWLALKTSTIHYCAQRVAILEAATVRTSVNQMK